MEEAGSALVSTIAQHWSVTDDTARLIIATAELKPVRDDGWKRYLWNDIWRLEGEIFVPRRLWSEFRERLLKTSELPSLDPEKRSARTFRRYVEQGKIPSIELSPDVTRVRKCVFDIAVHHV